MRVKLSVLLVCGLGVGAAVYAATRREATSAKPQAPPVVEKAPAKPPKIDIAIALDTSSSMTGLLQAARQKMWEIVNEVAKVKPTPDLRVALISYGKRGTEEDGFIEIQSDFTTDLDAIYAKLHQLDAIGGCGQERVTRAIARSVKELSWSAEEQTLRQIYVAGNESTVQDTQVSLAAAVKLAREKDIFVNAIFCAGATVKDYTLDDSKDVVSWRELARGGRGLFAAIDHEKGEVAVKSPYDEAINKLGAELNTTYVAYGKRGAAAAANQRDQDNNAMRHDVSVAATRALAKASAVYKNDRWDLVDARKAGKLKAVKAAELPAALQGKSSGEVNAYLDKAERRRRSIKQKIKKLAQQREAYVAKEVASRGRKARPTLSNAVKRALHTQAAQKFGKPGKPGKLRKQKQKPAL